MVDDGLICWSCGRPTGFVGMIGRSEQCPGCGSDLRSCKGCRHFDPSRRFQCREPIENPVVKKDASNFCDWFQVRKAMKGTGGIAADADSKDDRKKRFDDLFGE